MSQYSGPERRRNRVLVTANTEYHMRDRVCVGVRDSSGRWQAEHRAVGSELLATIGSEGRWLPYSGDLPPAGTRLLFSCDVLTSPIRQVVRPTLETVLAHYPEPGTTGKFVACVRRPGLRSPDP